MLRSELTLTYCNSVFNVHFLITRLNSTGYDSESQELFKINFRCVSYFFLCLSCCFARLVILYTHKKLLTTVKFTLSLQNLHLLNKSNSLRLYYSRISSNYSFFNVINPNTRKANPFLK